MADKYRQLRALAKEATDELITEGVQTITVDYENGFTLVLRDRKSSKYRSKHEVEK